MTQDQQETMTAHGQDQETDDETTEMMVEIEADLDQGKEARTSVIAEEAEVARAIEK